MNCTLNVQWLVFFLLLFRSFQSNQSFEWNGLIIRSKQKNDQFFNQKKNQITTTIPNTHTQLNQLFAIFCIHYFFFAKLEAHNGNDVYVVILCLQIQILIFNIWIIVTTQYKCSLGCFEYIKKSAKKNMKQKSKHIGTSRIII